MIKCEYCNRTFKNERGLKSHISKCTKKPKEDPVLNSFKYFMNDETISVGQVESMLYDKLKETYIKYKKLIIHINKLNKKKKELENEINELKIKKNNYLNICKDHNTIIKKIEEAKDVNKEMYLTAKKETKEYVKAILHPNEKTIKELQNMDYQEYLNSDWWKYIRKTAIERSGNKCQMCGSKIKLNVHHNTYKNRGCEEITDLICLCEKCHNKFHGK